MPRLRAEVWTDNMHIKSFPGVTKSPRWEKAEEKMRSEEDHWESKLDWLSMTISYICLSFCNLPDPIQSIWTFCVWRSCFWSRSGWSHTNSYYHISCLIPVQRGKTWSLLQSQCKIDEPVLYTTIFNLSSAYCPGRLQWAKSSLGRATENE